METVRKSSSFPKMPSSFSKEQADYLRELENMIRSLLTSTVYISGDLEVNGSIYASTSVVTKFT